MGLSLRYVAHSEIGLVRKNNQDSGYASPTMLAVADGMGGAAAGDLASAVAVHELKAADGPYRAEDLLPTLAIALERANERIYDLVIADNALDGMGTTVSAALFDGHELGIAHIGDSRVYRFRDGALERITHDHSWVQSLVDEGRISEEEAQYHPHRSLLLKVLNGQPVNIPDLFRVDVQEGDRILLCSDGLCGLVSDAVIAEILVEPEIAHVLTDLTEAAHHAGGLDNITIVLADVVEGPAEGNPEVLGAAADREIPKPALAPQLREDTAQLTREEPQALGEASAPSSLPQDPEALRYAPTTGRRRWGALVAVIATIVIAVLGLAYWGGWAYVQSQYYVGAAGSSVAIYQGVTESAFGMPLSSVIEVTGPQLADLPPFYQEQVRHSIPAKDLDAAHLTTAALQEKAAQCIAQRLARARATQTMPATPLPSEGSESETPKSSGTPVATQTPAPEPTAQPTASTAPSAPDEC